MVIQEIISPFQSDFITSKEISDNILIAHEIFHHMKKKISKRKYTAIKVDMSKVFDRVEWPYLLQVMKKMVLVINESIGSIIVFPLILLII